MVALVPPPLAATAVVIAVTATNLAATTAVLDAMAAVTGPAAASARAAASISLVHRLSRARGFASIRGPGRPSNGRPNGAGILGPRPNKNGVCILHIRNQVNKLSRSSDFLTQQAGRAQLQDENDRSMEKIESLPSFLSKIHSS